VYMFVRLCVYMSVSREEEARGVSVRDEEAKNRAKEKGIARKKHALATPIFVPFRAIIFSLLSFSLIFHSVSNLFICCALPSQTCLCLSD